jgi:hypothetical protein
VPVHVGREPHVEHPVRLVEHQYLEVGRVHVTPPHVIEQAAGGRDDDVDAPPEGLRLRVHGDATVDGGRLDLAVASVGARAEQDLLGQLTRGNQDQRPERAGAAFPQALEDRQDEGGGLAGAGLGGADHVAAVEAEGDCLQLDRGRLGVTLFPEGLQQFGHEAQ